MEGYSQTAIMLSSYFFAICENDARKEGARRRFASCEGEWLRLGCLNVPFRRDMDGQGAANAPTGLDVPISGKALIATVTVADYSADAARTQAGIQGAPDRSDNGSGWSVLGNCGKRPSRGQS